MGILKTQSTLTIAVWSSVLLHAAGFLGFELAFSNIRGEESFPKSEPRTVTIVSISSVTSIQNQVLEKESFQEPVPEKKELPHEIRKEIISTELVSDIGSPDKQENKTIFSEKTTTSSVSGSVEGEITKTEPVPLSSIEPEYSFRARKKGFEGVVVLEVVISKSGEPVSCQIIDTSGYEDLDNAAKKTVLSSLFQPGTVNGEDIESTLRISIKFQLN